MGALVTDVFRAALLSAGCLLWLCTSSESQQPQPFTIKSLLEHAMEYEGKQVRVRGIVANVAGGAGKGFYVLRDREGDDECFVVATSGLPKFQSEVTITATLNTVVRNAKIYCFLT